MMYNIRLTILIKSLALITGSAQLVDCNCFAFQVTYHFDVCNLHHLKEINMIQKQILTLWRGIHCFLNCISLLLNVSYTNAGIHRGLF
jgi:hypothetical protein